MIRKLAKYMKDKTIATIGTIKGAVSDPKNHIATGIVITCGGLGIGLGLIASGVIQMRIV